MTISGRTYALIMAPWASAGGPPDATGDRQRPASARDAAGTPDAAVAALVARWVGSSGPPCRAVWKNHDVMCMVEELRLSPWTPGLLAPPPPRVNTILIWIWMGSVLVPN